MDAVSLSLTSLYKQRKREMNLFKRNDRVRIVRFEEDSDDHEFMTLNDTGTVMQYENENCMLVAWDNPVDTDNGGMWWCDPKCCELENKE